MKITWWGTASFRLETAEETILIDPYLSRNPDARPIIRLKPEEITRADRILITHGHFDHIADVADIACRTRAVVYSDQVAAETMIREGLDPELCHTVNSDGEIFDFKSVQAQAYHSRHIKFDRRLMLATLLRMNYRLFDILKSLKNSPCGQVLSWRLTIEGKTLHHFGSGGSTHEELARLASQPTDILFVPLQGHTDICQIALDYVKALKPGIVIPHHQDDFFPPVSKMVDIEPFLDGVTWAFPETQVKVLTPGEPWTLDL